MSIRARIEDKLAAALAPERLEVADESHRHAGHSHSGGGKAFDGDGETHFRVRIVAGAFGTLSRIERHRTINELLREELQGGVHALAIEAAAPGEPTRW